MGKNFKINLAYLLMGIGSAGVVHSYSNNPHASHAAPFILMISLLAFCVATVLWAYHRAQTSPATGDYGTNGKYIE